MQKTHFKNLKDLLQNKYGFKDPKPNSRASSISEVMQNLKKTKETTPISEDLINFTKALGNHQQPRSKEKHAPPKNVEK